jgi:hypothetical protein
MENGKGFVRKRPWFLCINHGVFVKKLKYDFEFIELSVCSIGVKVSARVSLETWCLVF